MNDITIRIGNSTAKIPNPKGGRRYTATMISNMIRSGTIILNPKPMCSRKVKGIAKLIYSKLPVNWRIGHS